MGLCKTSTFSSWKSMKTCQQYHCKQGVLLLSVFFMAPLSFAQRFIVDGVESAVEIVAS